MRSIDLLLSVVISLSVVTSAVGQTPVGIVTGIPMPDANANAFSTSLRYDAGGDLYAWDGLNVWEQSGGTSGFNKIGSVSGGNSADAGPISFSQDGQTLLLSNGAGGNGFGGNGLFFTMPVSGGLAALAGSDGVLYTGDALALPAASNIPGAATKYFVYAGNGSFSGSSLSIYDSSADTSQIVIANGPGATTSIAIDPLNNSLYLGVGYGGNAGQIFSFTLAQIDAAYNSAAPINFLSGGTLFNPLATGSQSGAGLFFDKSGYLFSGGDGVTVFNPSGTIVYDQPAGPPQNYYESLTYNPSGDSVLGVPYGASSGTLFAAASYEPPAVLWNSASGGSWQTRSNWAGGSVPAAADALVFAGSTNGTATVTLDQSGSAASVTFGDSSANGNYSITCGRAGTLTLGTSFGASIVVLSGSQTVSPPIMLDGSLSVNTTAGSLLELSGDVDEISGTPATLVLSGGGELVLSGTNSFSGGAIVTGGMLELTNSQALLDGSSLTVGNDPALFGDTNGPVEPSEASPAAVPEPGTLWLFLVAAAHCHATALAARHRIA